MPSAFTPLALSPQVLNPATPSREVSTRAFRRWTILCVFICFSDVELRTPMVNAGHGAVCARTTRIAGIGRRHDATTGFANRQIRTTHPYRAPQTPAQEKIGAYPANCLAAARLV